MAHLKAYVWLLNQIQLLFRELLTAALELVSTCCCLSVAGCPNCIQVSHDFLHCNALHLVVVTPQELALQALLCDEYNEVLDKKAAVITLKVCTLLQIWIIEKDKIRQVIGYFTSTPKVLYFLFDSNSWSGFSEERMDNGSDLVGFYFFC